MQAKNLIFSHKLIPIIFSVLIISSCNSLSKGDDSQKEKDSTDLSEKSNLPSDNELAFLIGQQWVGDFGENSIVIQIKQVEPAENGIYNVSGFNTVLNNKRPIVGTMKQDGDKVKFTLNEPGDHKFDGVFSGIIFPSDGLAMRGSWTANKGQRTIGFSLENNNSSTVSTKKKEEIIEEAQKSAQFYPTAECVVVSKRTYFYSVPDYAYKTKSYLVEGDRVTVEKIQRNFLFISYYNEYSAQTTSGWIDCNEVEIFN
jgi:hypothetical protein